MTLYQAYMVLQHHAEWREGNKPEMIKPEKLTKALDVVLKYLDNKLTKENYASI